MKTLLRDLDELLGVRLLQIKRGHPYRKGSWNSCVLEGKICGMHKRDELLSVPASARPINLWQYYREFITTKAREDVLGPDRHLNGEREFLENRILGKATVVGGDSPEMIDLEDG